MGVDAKDVGSLLWKILRISTNSVYTCVRKYPVVSGVSTIIFLLYTFLPRLFYFMLCSSPVIAFSAFYLRNHLNFKPLNGLSSPFSQKGSERGTTTTTTTKADLKHQRSVRRNARRKVEEVGKDWDFGQASENERDKVILTTLYGEFPKNARKSPKLHKFKKDRAFLVSEEFSFEPSLDGETHSTTGNVSVIDPSEMLTSGGGETEVECSSSSSEGEQETIREEKKVLAWTEDDQKNLMDLGNSDIERNKRLEHMITRRRRTRRLTAERSLMDMEVPCICVGRNYFGLDEENYMVDGIQMPESAPCVLLPTKNPFDIPYDPQEEKPNLSGDSFQQEFSASNPNESFSRRVFPSESKRSIDSWPRPQQGTVCNGRLVGEKPLLTEEKDVTREEASDTMESERRTEIVQSDSNSLPSPGETEMDSLVSSQADSAGTIGKRNGDHRVGNSLVGVVPRNTGSLSSSLATERQIYMEHFGYSTKRNGHKVTQSVESDLQVEFSEIGSPPTTADGNNSSDDEKSLFVKETGFNGEATQKIIVERAAESQMLPVEKFDQDLNETSSLLSPEIDEAKTFEGLSDGTDVNGRSEEEERSKPVHSLMENPEHISEEASKREEESQDLLQNSVDEMKIRNVSDEPQEPSERRTNQELEEHIRRNDGGESAQETAEPEASNVNQVASDASATSPTSVLPDMSLPLDRTYTLASEDLELTAVIPEPDPHENQVGG